ncbi:hypothetical protein [Streptomyces radicis]|uniref:hypothetical protein n=1 Tax=Streptomyces radicis TaxID=1750517 RepID=UPI0011C3686A|nr:hypothetical protein [Streptomyces radicis]
MAFNPGNIRTSFATNPGAALRWAHWPVIRPFLNLRSPEEGADTLVHLAKSARDADFPSGEYVVRRKVARANKQANDRDLAAALWDRSMTLTKAT